MLHFSFYLTCYLWLSIKIHYADTVKRWERLFLDRLSNLGQRKYKNINKKFPCNITHFVNIYMYVWSFFFLKSQAVIVVCGGALESITAGTENWTGRNERLSQVTSGRACLAVSHAFLNNNRLHRCQRTSPIHERHIEQNNPHIVVRAVLEAPVSHKAATSNKDTHKRTLLNFML